MNRKKKIQSIHLKRVKKAKAKLHTPNKDKYVSKADREKIAQQAELDNAELKQDSADLTLN